MYYDDAFKKMIKEKGRTFIEVKDLLDQYNEVPTIKSSMNKTTLAQTLESYLIQWIQAARCCKFGVNETDHNDIRQQNREFRQCKNYK